MALRFQRHQLLEYWPDNQYRPLWEHDNRLVLKETTMNKPSYIFFVRDSEITQYYNFIISTKDFEFGKTLSEGFWRKDTFCTPMSQAEFQDLALGQIESTVISSLKKGQEANLEEVDFAFVYAKNKTWHAYYPPLEMLIRRYLSKHADTSDEVSKKYLGFLQGQELADKRKAWYEQDSEIILRNRTSTTEQ